MSSYEIFFGVSRDNAPRECSGRLLAVVLSGKQASAVASYYCRGVEEKAPSLVGVVTMLPDRELADSAKFREDFLCEAFHFAHVTAMSASGDAVAFAEDRLPGVNGALEPPWGSSA